MVEGTHTRDDLKQIYRARFRDTADYRSRIWDVLTRFFEQWIKPDGTVLDLGCGYCEFINKVRCGRKFGMDLNPDSGVFAGENVKVLEQDCSDVWPVAADSLDTVFTSNFFEHLPSKATLEMTLLEALRCLKPGGRLIAMGPNIRYLAGAYWDFFDHYLPLTERSLSEVLTKVGFAIEKSCDRFMPYTAVRTRQYPQFLIKLYLALPLAWKFLGKQFLVVAYKPL